MKLNLLSLIYACLFGMITTHSYLAQAECPTAPTPQLVIGQQGNVTPGPPNNVRDTPSREGTNIGEIPGGDIFIVLDGPVCDGEIYWWQVDYNGLIGWTAEGKNNAYWVEPVASTPTPLPTNTATPTITPTSTPTATATLTPLSIEKIFEADNDVRLRNLKFSPDGTMFSVNYDDDVRILDAQTFEILHEFDFEGVTELTNTAWVGETAWHPDGDQIAVGLPDRFQVYSLPDEELVWEKVLPHYFLSVDIEGNEDLFPQRIESLEFIPDTNQLVTLGDDGIARIWAYGADDPLIAINPRELHVENRQRGSGDTSNLDISSDGRILTFAFFSNDVILWNLALSGPLAIPPPLQSTAETKVRITSDGTAIYYHASFGSQIHIFDLATSEHTVIDIDGDLTNEVALHPTRDLIAYSVDRVEEPNAIIIADRPSLGIRAIVPIESGISSFEFTPDGEHLVIVEGFESISLWRING